MDAAQRLQEVNSDEHLYYFDGRLLFGEELAQYHLPDNLHPDADGNVLFGENFMKNILKKIDY